MQLTGEQAVKAYWNMCTIWELEERMHKKVTTGQIFGFVHRCASTHRDHGHSIKEGEKS
jgi:TPP-dependent pyruvate/acetoin dehydrogenase alpha subunit